MKICLPVCLLLLSVVPGRFASAQTAPWSVWAEHGSVKITQGSSAGSEQRVYLSGARGEYEPFQVAIRVEGTTGITGISASMSSLVHERDQAEISSSSVRLFREYFIYIGEGDHSMSMVDV